MGTVPRSGRFQGATSIVVQGAKTTCAAALEESATASPGLRLHLRSPCQCCTNCCLSVAMCRALFYHGLNMVFVVLRLTSGARSYTRVCDHSHLDAGFGLTVQH